MTDSSAPTAEKSLFATSGGVALGTLLSRLTGLARVVAVAVALGDAQFGAIYALANQSPNLIYELLIGGILSATLVPVLVAAHDRGDEDGPSALMSVGAVVIAVLAVVAVIGAPVVSRLYGIGPGDSERYELMVLLSRLILPEIFFYGFTALASAALNAKSRFFAPAYTPILNNVIVIALMAFIARRDELDASRSLTYVIGLGTTLGIVAMSAALLPSMRAAGLSYRWNFDLRSPLIARVVRMAGWTMGYVAANQVALLFVMNLVRRSGDSDVTAYTNAFIFFQLPHALIAVTVMTTYLPSLSQAAARRDGPAFTERFAEGARLLVIGTVPAAVAYTLIAGPLATVVFQSIPGRYSEAGTVLTGSTLASFAVGLPAFSLYLLTLRGFYAHQDTRTPFFVNLGENATNVALALLVSAAGAVGLARAYSVAYWLAMVAALVLLHRRAAPFSRAQIDRGVRLVAQVAAASAVMGVVMAVARLPFDVEGIGGSLTYLLVAVPLGGAAFVGVCLGLRVDEIHQFAAIVRRRSPTSGGSGNGRD